jgi:hypothetical protein
MLTSMVWNLPAHDRIMREAEKNDACQLGDRIAGPPGAFDDQREAIGESFTRGPSLRVMIRKPSCLISCSRKLGPLRAYARATRVS